jgi:hypothetical protein
MKKSRFTDGQILETLWRAWRFPRAAESLGSSVRRDRYVHDGQAQGAGGRERLA